MPALERAFKSGDPIRIAALGSSSTQGAGASSKELRYPARLEAELRRRFGDSDIEVANLGVGGELASDMLKRIDAQVLPLKPALVIWQTGVNDAIRSVGIDEFRNNLQTGIRIFRKRHIDVVLLDHQYYPGAAKLPGFDDYLQAMHDMARQEKIPLLSRYRIMEHLVSTGQYAINDLLAGDRFHLNDVSYGCLGTAMADALENSIQHHSAPTAAAVPATLVKGSN